MNILKGITTDAWDSLQVSFNLLWSKLAPLLLPIIFVLIFLALGLLIAGFLSDKIGDLVKKSKIDSVLDRIVDPVLSITGTKVNPTGIIVGTVKWFLVATVLLAALDLADLDGVTNFVYGLIPYLKSVFVAALILVAGSLVANLAAFIAGLATKGNFPTTVRVAVNALAFIAAIGLVISPIVAALSGFIGHLALSRLQSDVLYIGILVLALLASKNAVTKVVENLFKS